MMRITAVAVLVLMGGLVWMLATSETPAAVCDALARGRIVHLYLDAPLRVSCAGVDVRDLQGSPVGDALAGNDVARLAQVLARDKGSAVAVVPGSNGTGIQGRIAHLEHVVGLRGVALSNAMAVYVPFREPQLSAREGDALAYVARALLRGAREPNVASFPAALRKVERVEVIVTISEHGEPRLWRSARGTSLARTMMTATRVARDRWHEREQAMGGPLHQQLLGLDVEVGLLSEDGTLFDTQPSFVDRAITRVHGIGFDYRSGWHYLSPADVQKRGGGSAFKALSALLRDQNLGVSALSDRNLRLYRFVPSLLGVSKAPVASAESGAD